MTPHIFILGPSGVGKSFVAAAVSVQRDYLHVELDGTSWTPARKRPSLASRIRTRLETGRSLSGAEFEAVSFGSLGRPWRRFLSGDAFLLTKELRRRADQAAAAACVVSFPSGVVLATDTIATAKSAGIMVRILYGTTDDCVSAFLAREATTTRRLDREHWNLYNGSTYHTFGLPELDPYRVQAFGTDGSRLPVDLLVNAVCG